MSAQKHKNLPESVRQRLLKLSAARREPFDLLLARFAVERLLYRLGTTRHANRFLLKGAMLFAVWLDNMHRPTRDVDLLGFGTIEAGEIQGVFKEVCETSVPEDGLVFVAKSLSTEPIREDVRYGGIRVKLQARLANVRIPVQIDIGVGDVVTPAPEIVTFPALLDFAAPSLRAYPVYTVIAEKTEALVYRGEINTRMKDFFDLRFMGRTFELDGALMLRALSATFERRETTLPREIPYGLTDAFVALRESFWRAFLKRNGLVETSFAETVAELREMLMPVLRAAKDGNTFGKTWKPGLGWRETGR